MPQPKEDARGRKVVPAVTICEQEEQLCKAAEEEEAGPTAQEERRELHVPCQQKEEQPLRLLLQLEGVDPEAEQNREPQPHF